MRYYPFASIEAAPSKKLARFTRVLGALSILGFYITLIIAALVFISTDSAQLASNQANQILINGIIISGSALGLSAMFAFFLSNQIASRQSI